MLNDLYVVDYPDNARFAEAVSELADYDHEKYVSCPQCGSRVSGSYWVHPREAKLTKHNIPDFLYTVSSNTPFLLSERALKEIRQAGMTGLICAEEIESVSFQRKSKKSIDIPKYYYIELARSPITIDHKNSQIIYGGSYGGGVKCPLCRQIPRTYDFFRGLAFQGNDENIYDMFHIYELGDTVLLSQRFVDFYHQSGLTGLCFSPAKEYGRESTDFLFGKENE